jgi:hypothetical protein
MATKTKTNVEADGSIDFSKQNDSWLQERLNGVIESIKANETGGHPEDIETFKNIVNEMKNRGMIS